MFGVKLTHHAFPPGSARRAQSPFRSCAKASAMEAGRESVPRQFDVVIERIREAIALCPEVEVVPEQELEFAGIQRVTIAA